MILTLKLKSTPDHPSRVLSSALLIIRTDRLSDMEIDDTSPTQINPVFVEEEWELGREGVGREEDSFLALLAPSSEIL